MGTESRRLKPRPYPNCYLCAQPETVERPFTRDHVPAKNVFPVGLREFTTNLKSLRAHADCNRSYSEDEQYFLSELGPLAADDPVVGPHVLNDLRKAYQHPQQRKLGQSIADAFSKLVLPNGMVAKQFHYKRIDRVAWKIVRGLYTLETQLFLPENLPRRVELFEPEALRQGIKSLDYWELVIRSAPMAAHARIFDYAVLGAILEDAELGLIKAEAWSMMFWNRVIVCVAYHSAVCPCKKCSEQAVVDTKVSPI